MILFANSMLPGTIFIPKGIQHLATTEMDVGVYQKLKNITHREASSDFIAPDTVRPTESIS